MSPAHPRWPAVRHYVAVMFRTSRKPSASLWLEDYRRHLARLDSLKPIAFTSLDGFDETVPKMSGSAGTRQVATAANRISVSCP